MFLGLIKFWFNNISPASGDIVASALFKNMDGSITVLPDGIIIEKNFMVLFTFITSYVAKA